MPARGHASDIRGHALRAAARFLRCRDEGENIAADAIASQYGIAVGTLYATVKKLRRERRLAAGQVSP